MRLTTLLLSSVLAVSSSYASPAGIRHLAPLKSPETEHLINEGIKLARSQGEIEKRASADFSLEKTFKDEVLFSAGEAEKLSITCLDCSTHGTVTAAVTNHHLIHPKLKLSFSGVEAYASVGVEVGEKRTFSVPLFESETPFGIGIDGLDVGVRFFVDLVFDVDAALEVAAGFQVSVPDGAFVEADFFKGDVDDSSFEGLNSTTLPITVTSGQGTFKADLRLRVQAGAEASLPIFDIGAGAEIGVYANIVEFVAVIDKTPTCDVETEIFWDLNVGAFAQISVVIDMSTHGPVPTVSTTLLTAPILSTCLIEATSTTSEIPAITASSPMETGSGLPTTFSSHSSQASGMYSYPVYTHTYPVPISSSSSTPPPAQTSTYTHTMTLCNAPGAMNCPLPYQTEVVVTRTTTLYPAASTAKAAGIFAVPAKPIGDNANAIAAVALTPLATPVVQTFVAPPMATAVQVGR
ncbi:hypothetical protein F4808DRAFT_425331 [Astrocystis sublimbata]|nr:hypothetical protein F4808DRAFT_425331 [Astrocystis sublimbata]